MRRFRFDFNAPVDTSYSWGLLTDEQRAVLAAQMRTLGEEVWDLDVYELAAERKARDERH